MKKYFIFFHAVCLLLSINKSIAQTTSESSEVLSPSANKPIFVKNEAIHFDTKLLQGNWITDLSQSDNICSSIFEKESYIDFISDTRAIVFFNEKLELYYKLENNILFFSNKEGDYYRDAKQRCQVISLTDNKLVLLVYYNNKKIQVTLIRK